MKRCGNTVFLGFAHEGRRSLDAQTFDLGLKIAGHVIGARGEARLEPTRHAARDGTEAPITPCRDQLQRLETIG